MHPLALLLILVAAGAGAASVPAHSPYDTPAARFWEKALPGTPMPQAIANLVQEGIAHSPLKEHRSAPYFLPNDCLSYTIGCKPPPNGKKTMVPPGLFFHKTQVSVGSTMTVSFSPPAVMPVLPRDVAKNVPFGNLAGVLSTFNIAPSSAEAAKVSDTLSECQASVPAAEKMACTTSVEATVQSALRMLGTTNGVWVAASSLTRAGLPRQTYVVQAVTRLDGGRHVGCHAMPFPYAVFQCHMTNEASEAYMMSIRGLNGAPTVAMAALCHLDTSKWNPAHPAFEILHTQPGGTPVCHFMPYAHLLFGEKPANA